MLVDKKIIQSAKNKLGDKNMELIVQLMNLENYDEKNQKASCKHHADKTPSLIFNKKMQNAHCFSCGKNIDIIDALMYSGMTYIEAVQKLFEITGYADKHKGLFGTKGVKTQRQHRYPKEVPLNDKKKVKEYLKGRMIPKAVVDLCDVREDEQGNIAFQYYDSEDVLSMVKYRPSRPLTKDDTKAWVQRDSDGMSLLWNMNRVNTTSELLICEGEIDAMSAIASGYLNAVSVPFGASGATWIQHNFDWLEQFESIIICSDNDAAGEKMRKEIIPRLGSWRCKVANVPYSMVLEDGTEQPISDLNELLCYCGREAVMNAIITAQDTPVPSLIDISTVKNIDYSDIEGVLTGFSEIDRELHKLFYGSFNVVSGSPGSGKTSFLYGLVSNAVEQDVNSWVFSRELPTFQSKNWIHHILAGRHNHTEHCDERSGTKYYTVNPDAQENIDDYIAGKIMFYRDDYPNDIDSIMESMISATRKHNCKLFIIDNLMTIDIGSNENNKNERQTDLVNKLIQFAMKYQTAVLLVAHPNKTQNTSEDVGMYQVSGSSNIANLAHRMLSMRRISAAEKKADASKPDVVFSVIKDRFMGKAGSYFDFYYDNVDRRFYSNNEEFDKNYSWDIVEHPKICSDRFCDGEVFGDNHK